MNKIFYKMLNVCWNIRWITRGIADWWPCWPLSCCYLMDVLFHRHLTQQFAVFKNFTHHWSVSAKLLLKNETRLTKTHLKMFILLQVLFVNVFFMFFCIKYNLTSFLSPPVVSPKWIIYYQCVICLRSIWHTTGTIGLKFAMHIYDCMLKSLSL